MELDQWKQSAEKQFSYRRRRPELTPLYRVLFEYRDELEYAWEDHYQMRYGVLREEVKTAFDRYLNCGILRFGAARATCPDCNHSILIAFSCKRRGLCPSCDAKRAHLFAETITESVLLPYPTRHIVFTIPKRLRVYFKYDRTLTLHLYTAAWSAWRATAAPNTDTQTGLITSLHSSGDLLNFHPHLHAIALSGNITRGDFSAFDPAKADKLEQLFADYLFQSLLDEELIDQNTIDSMRSWEHSGFSVFVGNEIKPEDTERLLFLARYLKRPPLALERMELLEHDSGTTVRITKSSDEPQIYRDFTPLDFLAELSQHIPNTFEQTVRYFGEFSARTRGKKRALEEAEKTIEPLPSAIHEREVERPTSASWARLIKKVYEVDPLKCSRCGGKMKIIAFIENENEIKRICRNLGLEDWRAPPTLKRCTQTEIFE